MYCVSVAGITGERHRLPPELLEQLAWHDDQRLPLCVGFGMSRPDHVRMLRDAADGVIVGTQLVRPLEQVGKRPLDAVIKEIGDLAQRSAALSIRLDGTVLSKKPLSPVFRGGGLE